MAHILAFLIICLSFSHALATDYFVSTTGNDSADGLSEGNAWLTLARAVTFDGPAGCGDTINMVAGSYAGLVTITGWNCTKENPITLKGPRTAIIDGTLTGSGQQIRITASSGGIVLDGFTIRDHTGAGVFVGTNGFETGACRVNSVVIKNLAIHDQIDAVGVDGHGIWLDGSENQTKFGQICDIEITDNELTNLVTGEAGAYDEALTLSRAIDGFTITGNILDNVSMIGIDVIGRLNEGIPTNGLIANNVVKNSGTASEHTALYVDGATNVTMEDNVCLDNIGVCIVASAEQAGIQTRGVIIRRNISVDQNGRAIIVGGTAITAPATLDTCVAHNVSVLETNLAQFRTLYSRLSGEGALLNNMALVAPSVTTDFADIRNIETKDGPFTWRSDGNLFSREADVFWEEAETTTFFATLALWRSGTGQDANSLVGTPIFETSPFPFVEGVSSYELAAGSPGIDDGVSLATVSAINGNILTLSDESCFSPGHGRVTGDTVQIGLDQGNIATVVARNSASNTITLDRTVMVELGNTVNYPFNGLAPDIGRTLVIRPPSSGCARSG